MSEREDKVLAGVSIERGSTPLSSLTVFMIVVTRRVTTLLNALLVVVAVWYLAEYTVSTILLFLFGLPLSRVLFRNRIYTKSSSV